jgi:hypothetical protein
VSGATGPAEPSAVATPQGIPPVGVVRLALAAVLAAQAIVMFRGGRLEGRVLWTVAPSHGLAVGDVVGIVLAVAAVVVLVPLLGLRRGRRRPASR